MPQTLGLPSAEEVVERATADDRLGLRRDRVAPRVGVRVADLDEQPALAPALAVGAGQRKGAAQLLAVQADDHVAAGERLVDRDLLAVAACEVLVGAAIPDDHRAGPGRALEV